MTLKGKHSILFVDDEVSITKALQRLFRKQECQILTASSGQAGLELLEKAEKPVSLIISDQRMPEMTGAQFLEKAKTIFPDAIRFLLTGYSDLDAIADAVNKGEIHRYLTKPWNDDDLLLQVRQALEQYELVLENRGLLELTNKQNKRLNELNKDLEKKVEKRTGEIIQKNKELEEVNKRLENSFMDAIRLLSSLVESLNPDLGRHMRQVAKISREIAEEYGLDRQAVDQIEIAGRLHDIGLLGLPETILEKHEKEMNAEELEVFRPHPTIGQICLQPLENLDQVAAIILSHHEHYNGSGFPNGLKGEDIPLGARIICAVSDYCKIVRTWPRGVKEIMEKAERYIGPSARDILVSERKIMIDEITRRIFLVGASKKYDPDVVQKLANKIGSFGMEGQPEKGQDEIVSVHVDELKVGMVLAMTLRTRDGRFVLGSGSVLNKTQVLGLQRLTTGEAIESQIYVLRNQGLAERS